MKKSLMLIFFSTTIGCTVYQETDFRVSKKEQYYREDGNILWCSYNKDEDRIVINFCTDESCDYYHVFNLLDSDSKFDLI